MLRAFAFPRPSFIVAVATFLLHGAFTAFALGEGPAPANSDDSGVRKIRLEAFVRSDKESATEVQAYLDQLDKRVPGLDIQIHDVLSDRQQLARLYELSKKFGRTAVVPSFYCCDRMYFGFGGKEMSDSAIQDLFTAKVYTRTTCPRCQDAKRFIKQLEQEWPAIRFQIFEITGNPVARGDWERLCRSAGQVPGLPTLEFARRIIVGYQGDSITGRQWSELIEAVSGTSEDANSAPGSEDTGWLFLRGPTSLVGAVSIPSLPLLGFFFSI